jgi:hypothetical protein
MLPQAIQGYLSEGRISEGHARPLMMLNDRPEEQTVLAKEILLKRLTVRESEALARRVAQDKVSSRHKIDPEILELERSLTEKLGTRVTIEPREVGGRLVISFFNASDLATLLEAMRVDTELRDVSVFNGDPSAPKADLVHETHVDESTAGVVPDPSYPAPEQVEGKPEVFLEGVFGVSTETTTPIPEHKAPPAQKTEEEPNLYTIRDFCI